MTRDNDSAERSTPTQGRGAAEGQLSAVVLAALGDVSLPVEVRIGHASLSLDTLLACTPGTVIELDAEVGEPADVLIGGRVIARGELVAVGEKLGVRIIDIVTPGADNG